nr:DUF6708 domain-containing protein [Burkholderia contaminans]
MMMWLDRFYIRGDLTEMERLEFDMPRDDSASIPSLEVDEWDAIRSLNITHLDDVYMEVSFATPIRRMIELCGYVVISPLLLALPAFGIFSGDAGFFLFLLLMSVFLGAILYVEAYRIFHRPQDQPIRFNRARGKVYFYYYKDRPCALRRSRVIARGYAWGQLCMRTWSTARGHSGIEVIAVKPATNKTIFTCSIPDALIKIDLFAGGVSEDFWHVCEAYMAYGADILKETGAFSVGHGDVSWKNESSMNLAMRLASKVVWPAKMDVESRTAPDGVPVGDGAGVPSWFRSVAEDD